MGPKLIQVQWVRLVDSLSTHLSASQVLLVHSWPKFVGWVQVRLGGSDAGRANLSGQNLPPMQITLSAKSQITKQVHCMSQQHKDKTGHQSNRVYKCGVNNIWILFLRIWCQEFHWTKEDFHANIGSYHRYLILWGRSLIRLEHGLSFFLFISLY